MSPVRYDAGAERALLPVRHRGASADPPPPSTGFQSIVPYFYVAYFGALLVHRELRDEHACQEKYGADYDRYRKMVRSRIIPYVY